MSHHGMTSPAPLPFLGQIAPKMYAHLVRWSCGARGRVPRLPASIRVDNGPEFVSKDLDLWAYANGVILDFSRPGKPTDNSFVEAFNGKVRAECIDQNWFLSLEDAKLKCEAFRHDYNHVRPHSSIGLKAPVEFMEIRRRPQPADRIIARESPQAAVQRQTVVFDVPVAAIMAFVPTPSALSSTIRAPRHVSAACSGQRRGLQAAGGQPHQE